MATSTGHLPTRPQRRAPTTIDRQALHRATGLGLEVTAVAGECVACGVETATDWHPATLDGLRHRHDADLVVGHVCDGCLPWAQERAEASRKEARRTSTLRHIER